jgi:hypothetical protein
MARDHFDLDSVRKNWDRATVPERAPLPAKLAEVRAPRDPFAAARALLTRVRARALDDLAPNTEAIAPFLNRAADLLARMEAAPREGRAPLAQEFLKTLEDLEDLFEVFAGIGR